MDELSRRRDYIGVLEQKVKLQFWRKTQISGSGGKKKLGDFGLSWNSDECVQSLTRDWKGQTVLFLCPMAFSDTTMQEGFKFTEEKT